MSPLGPGRSLSAAGDEGVRQVVAAELERAALERHLRAQLQRPIEVRTGSDTVPSARRDLRSGLRELRRRCPHSPSFIHAAARKHEIVVIGAGPRGRQHRRAVARIDAEPASGRVRRGRRDGVRCNPGDAFGEHRRHRQRETHHQGGRERRPRFEATRADRQLGSRGALDPPGSDPAGGHARGPREQPHRARGPEARCERGRQRGAAEDGGERPIEPADRAQGQEDAAGSVRILEAPRREQSRHHPRGREGQREREEQRHDGPKQELLDGPRRHARVVDRAGPRRKPPGGQRSRRGGP